MWIDGSMKMKKVKLESLALPEKGAIISGPFGSNISSKFFVERGVPVIRGNNLCLDYSKFNDSGFVFITQEKADELNCWADKEDLLFTAAGTLGQVGVLKEPLNFTRYVISNKQIRVRLDSTKVNTLYAYYWFSSPWMFKRIAGVNKGSTVPLLTLAEIRDLPIFLPENRSTQDAVVEVLESISNKIALNKKMNQKLETMAKRLYDYWFVQYDFPDKNGHPYKTTGGPMTYNPTLKREIPAGWKVKKLGESVEILKDGTHNPPLRVDNGIPLLTGTMFGDNFLDYTKATYISREDYLAIHSKYQPLENDIIITKIGTLGNVNILRDTDIPIAIHCNSALLRFKKFFGSYYPFFFCKSDLFQLRLKSVKGQSIQEFASLDKIASVLCEIPKEEILNSFNKTVEPIMRQLIRTSKEITCLTTLRDKLLPLLMNGQVVVG